MATEISNLKKLDNALIVCKQNASKFQQQQSWSSYRSLSQSLNDLRKFIKNSFGANFVEEYPDRSKNIKVFQILFNDNYSRWYANIKSYQVTQIYLNSSGQEMDKLMGTKNDPFIKVKKNGTGYYESPIFNDSNSIRVNCNMLFKPRDKMEIVAYDKDAIGSECIGGMFYKYPSDASIKNIDPLKFNSNQQFTLSGPPNSCLVWKIKITEIYNVYLSLEK